MTALVIEKLKTLSVVLTDLRERVRAALASEIGRAVGGAVREVVQSVLTGTTSGTISPRLDGPDRATTAAPWSAGKADPWDDDPWDDDRDDARAERTDPAVSGYSPVPEPPAAPPVAAAVAAGASAAGWWLAGGGGLLAACGVGLAVGLLGLAGGPVARAGLAVLAAAADLTAVTDALGRGAARPATV